METINAKDDKAYTNASCRHHSQHKRRLNGTTQRAHLNVECGQCAQHFLGKKKTQMRSNVSVCARARPFNIEVRE